MPPHAAFPFEALQFENLAGVHDPRRVERPLHRHHGRESRLAMLGQKIFALALPDPVLARDESKPSVI